MQKVLIYPLTYAVSWHRACVLNRKIHCLAHHLALVGSGTQASPGTQDPGVALCFLRVSSALLVLYGVKSLVMT